jgi:hypothetical protein
MSGSDVKERLAVSLTLTIAGTAHKVVAGSIKRLSLELWSWGFEGEAEFVLTDTQGNKGKDNAALLKAFLKPELVEVALEVKSVLPETSSQPNPTPLKLKGYVTGKTLAEEVITTGDSDLVLHRRYGVRFTDAARLLWRQHYPCALYTQKTLKDVLDAHKGDKITLTYDWAAVLENQRPLIFVGLEPQRGASFYDWVLWLVHSNVGVFSYDYPGHGYRIASAKDASGTPENLFALNLSELEVVFPEVIRHEVTVLNAIAEGPQTEAVTQEQKVTGIRQDVLLVTPIADEVQARVDLETARLKVVRGPEVELTWRSFPEKALTPGALVKLPANAAWSAAGVAKDTAFRVRDLRLSAEVTDEMGQEEVYGDPYALFSFQMRTRLEPQDALHVELPAWQPPAYPRYVEGLIVSEQGGDEDETWQAYTDSATSQDGYKVKIPLYEDQIVAAPFNPNLLPGHFYFPAYKGERVLVALDLYRAWIKRFLDWRTGARMPQDGQGVQLLVGKTTENGTAIKHYYTDDKPVFLMQRTHEKDTQKLQIGEGNLLIEVKEEPS